MDILAAPNSSLYNTTALTVMRLRDEGTVYQAARYRDEVQTGTYTNGHEYILRMLDDVATYLTSTGLPI